MISLASQVQLEGAQSMTISYRFIVLEVTRVFAAQTLHAAHAVRFDGDKVNGSVDVIANKNLPGKSGIVRTSLKIIPQFVK